MKAIPICIAVLLCLSTCKAHYTGESIEVNDGNHEVFAANSYKTTVPASITGTVVVNLNPKSKLPSSKMCQGVNWQAATVDDDVTKNKVLPSSIIDANTLKLDKCFPVANLIAEGVTIPDQLDIDMYSAAYKITYEPPALFNDTFEYGDDICNKNGILVLIYNKIDCTNTPVFNFQIASYSSPRNGYGFGSDIGDQTGNGGCWSNAVASVDRNSDITAGGCCQPGPFGMSINGTWKYLSALGYAAGVFPAPPSRSSMVGGSFSSTSPAYRLALPEFVQSRGPILSREIGKVYSYEIIYNTGGTEDQALIVQKPLASNYRLFDGIPTITFAVGTGGNQVANPVTATSCVLPNATAVIKGGILVDLEFTSLGSNCNYLTATVTKKATDTTFTGTVPNLLIYMNTKTFKIDPDFQSTLAFTNSTPNSAPTAPDVTQVFSNNSRCVSAGAAPLATSGAVSNSIVPYSVGTGFTAPTGCLDDVYINYTTVAGVAGILTRLIIDTSSVAGQFNRITYPATRTDIGFRPVDEVLSCPLYMSFDCSGTTYNKPYNTTVDSLETNVTCFPADAIVDMIDGSKKTMADLKIGDFIKTGDDDYSEVFFFSHQLIDANASFVNLTVESGESIRLTAGHYIYIDGVPKPAGQVQIGDKTSNGIVSAISYSIGQGIYNPHTLNGDIVVNGFITSTYTDAVSPILAHAMLAPLRALYSINQKNFTVY